MGAFKPISKIDKRSGGLSITADSYDRLCLSKELQKELNATDRTEIYLFFDEEDRRIGLTLKAVPDHVPYVFDKRGTVKATDFMERCGIDTSEQPIKFLYDGAEKGLMAFRQAGVKRPTRFKADKNGNLEKLD
jgi:hypothetical protein